MIIVIINLFMPVKSNRLTLLRVLLVLHDRRILAQVPRGTWAGGGFTKYLTVDVQLKPMPEEACVSRSCWNYFKVIANNRLALSH
jgi:hypothetical protein